MTQREHVEEKLRGPATLQAVVEAIVRVKDLDEAEMQDAISAGNLRGLFPFKPHKTDVPPDFVPRDQLVRASALPLERKARKTLIQSSMPPRKQELDSEFGAFVAEWNKIDKDSVDAIAALRHHVLKSHD